MDNREYSLDKHNRVLIISLIILYTLKFILIMPKTAYHLGYNYGGLLFLLIVSFIISFIFWYASKKNLKSANSGFRVTFYILFTLSILSFFAKVGKNLH